MFSKFLSKTKFRGQLHFQINKCIQSSQQLEEQFSDLKLKLDVFNDDQGKRYYFTQNNTFEDIKKKLMEESKQVRSVNFKINGENIENLNQKYLEMSILNNIKLDINRKETAYQIDIQDGLAFYYGREYDAEFQKHEIPQFDSQILNNFNLIFEENLDKEPNHVYSKEDINRLIDESIKTFSLKNQRKMSDIPQIISHLDQQLQLEQQKINQAYDKSQNSALKHVKFFIFVCCVQWAVLFYLTYYAYGWDFCEPIAYLIDLSYSSFALWLFLKRKSDPGQSYIYARSLQKAQKKFLGKLSTNPMVSKKFVENRVNFFKTKMLYGQSV